MYRKIRIILFCAVFMINNAYAYDENSINAKFNKAGIATPQLHISSDNWIIYDNVSHQIIDGEKVNDRIAMGDFTRLMLIYMIFSKIQSNELSLNYKINLPKKEIGNILKQTNKSNAILDLYKPLILKDVLLASIINNNKDASLILSYLLDENNNNLIYKMNQAANRLNLNDTNFDNILGTKHPSHYTSVQNLLTLTSRIIIDFSDLSSLLGQKSFLYDSINYENKNYILDIDKDVIFALSGTIENKPCLIVNKKRKEKNITHENRQIITIITKSSNIELQNQESLKMLNYGFGEFDTVKIYEANHIISKAKIWLGNKNIVNIGVLSPAYISLPKGLSTRLTTILDKPKYIYAPIKKGEIVGYIKWINDKKEIYKIPAVALENVGEAGFLSQWIDKIRLIFD